MASKGVEKKEPKVRSSELKDALQSVDKEGKGYVSRDDVVLVLRTMGLYPTAHLVKLETHGKTNITYQEVEAIMEKCKANLSTPTPEQIRDIFKVVDPRGTGKINSATLRELITTLSERMTAAEADELMKEADPQNTGKVDYDRLCASLIRAYGGK